MDIYDGHAACIVTLLIADRRQGGAGPIGCHDTQQAARASFEIQTGADCPVALSWNAFLSAINELTSVTNHVSMRPAATRNVSPDSPTRPTKRLYELLFVLSDK